MLHPSDEYGRRALAFVGALREANTADEIARLTITELDTYGLSFVTSWSTRRDVVAGPDSVDLNTRPPDYCEHYLRNELQLRDPVMLAMRRSLAAMSWSEVLASFSWTKAERALVAEGRDFGANDGFIVPIFSDGAFLGAFSACGWNPDLSEGARSALQLVGMSAHQALMRVSLEEKRRDERHRPLTPREREVVRWVANGKGNEDIGDILGIATATVKTILARAQAKLNAASRTAAVVQALRLGEIDLGV